MATPEDQATQLEDSRPDLRVLPGGLLEESVELTPVPPDEFDLLVDSLDKDNYVNMTAEQLLVKRDMISEHQAEVARRIIELQQQFDAGHRELLWINGFIRDRR